MSEKKRYPGRYPDEVRERAVRMSIRYSERLADRNIIASVGSKGDSYDNAMAESFNGLY